MSDSSASGRRLVELVNGHVCNDNLPMLAQFGSVTMPVSQYGILIARIGACALALCFCATTFGADGIDSHNDQAALGFLKTGVQLEQSRKWLEAVQHYEKATRALPRDEEIKLRLLISRIHYDVNRRCQDPSLLEAARTLPTDQALELYSEVLSRVEMSYVDPINMTEIVRGGTAYLEVALTEPRFTSSFLQNQDPALIEQFRTSIHRVALARQIRDRHEARTIVSTVAAIAQRDLALPPTATVLQFICGAVGMLDPYSSFLSSGELSEVESQIEGNFVGLGIALQPHEVPLRILNVIPHGPAQEAGLLPGDRIVEVGVTRCSEVGAERAADLLRGPENSQVRLLVQRDEEPSFEVTINRRRVEVASLEKVFMIDPAAGIAHLKITSFQKTTTQELDEALWTLHRQGMRSLIIDLRGNPGGWFDAAVAVSDRFLAKGGIVSTRGKNGIENQNYSATLSGTWQLPLFVLVDGESASASEIFAGAIRDNKRGKLIGSTTYGKGSVQGLFPTKSFPGGVRLTVSKFYSPDGIAISERGVVPHVPVNATQIVANIQQSDSVRYVAKPMLDADKTAGSGTVRALRPKIGNDGASQFGDTSATDAVLATALEQAKAASHSPQLSRN